MPPRREAADESRERLLMAGEELLDEMVRGGLADPLRLVSPTEIARRAGRSKALLYHLWPVTPDRGDRLASYREELLDRVLRRPYDPAGVATAAESAASDDMAELVRVVGKFEFDRFAPGGQLAAVHRSSVILAAAAELGGDVRRPDVSNASSSEQYHELRELYAALLERYGLQVRPPLTLDHLTVMLSAMTEGFALEVWFSGELLAQDLDWDEGGVSRRWSPFSIAVLGVLDKITEPRSCASPGCWSQSVVLLETADTHHAVALCDRHLWAFLATEDEPAAVLVVHHEPNGEIAKGLFPDATRTARRVVNRWLAMQRAPG